MLAVMLLGCVRSAEGATTSFNGLGLISDGAALKRPVPSGTRDRKAPTVPSSFKAQSATASSITTSWIASSDNRGVTSYRTYRNKKTVANGLWTTYTFTGLACGTTYALAVDAADAAGNRSAKAQLAASTGPCTPTADTTPPSPVSGLHLTATTQTSITYAWNAATDNVAVAGYNMLKAGVKVGSTSSLSYTYTGLACGTTYTLAVQTYDAAGNTSNPALATAINSTSACTPTPDTTPPTAPTNLAATPGQTSVTLNWSASTDTTGVTGYTAYNGTATLGTSTTTSYTATGLNCNTGYSFSVDAYDAAGNHSGKTQISTNTSACSPPPGSATVFMSPSGSDSNPCTQSQPCASFDRAYRVATPGATVQVAAGSYPGQTINPDASKTSTTDVVFRPATGASVTVTGEIEANGSHFELRDMTTHQINFPRSADDITLRNVINHGMWMQGPSNISIIGGEITCGACGYHSHIQNGSDGHPPTNILWDGVNFHDWASQSGEHVECLQILGGDNVTIRNSIFKNCGTANGGLGATADVHIAWVATGTAMTKNILFENNFFYASGNPYAIQVDDYANVDFRYNSIAGPVMIWDRSGPGTGIDFVGNIMRAGPCTAESSGVAINWRYNVIQGGTCGATDKNAASGFMDVNNNLHLAPGAAAINAGDPTSFPTFDFDGQGRAIGSAPDAGADEAG